MVISMGILDFDDAGRSEAGLKRCKRPSAKSSRLRHAARPAYEPPSMRTLHGFCSDLEDLDAIVRVLLKRPTVDQCVSGVSVITRTLGNTAADEMPDLIRSDEALKCGRPLKETHW
jgi:hypothetical protein